jgi:hypothetical protein
MELLAVARTAVLAVHRRSRGLAAAVVVAAETSLAQATQAVPVVTTAAAAAAAGHPSTEARPVPAAKAATVFAS